VLDVTAGPDPLKPLTSDNMTAPADQLFQELYAELKHLASSYMRRQSPAHTLQATALVAEAYLKMEGSRCGRWGSRPHFMACAAQAMRWVLVDHARHRATRAEASPRRRVRLDGLLAAMEEGNPDIEALHEALTTLEQLGGKAKRAARVVEIRFFAGQTMAEIATALEITERTVRRDWEFFRTWLATTLK